VCKYLPTASENIELADLPQRVADVDTALKRLVSEVVINIEGPPM